MNKMQDILQFFLINFEYDRLDENIALKIIANDVGSPLWLIELKSLMKHQGSNPLFCLNKPQDD